MSLKTRELNEGLLNGYTSEGLQKDGARCTFFAGFSMISNPVSAHLEQSVDGETYQEIPDSATTIEIGQTAQMWNDDMLPRGTMLRIVVGSGSGTITQIKLLSNG